MPGLLKHQMDTLKSNGFTDGEVMMINRDLGSRPQALDLNATPWKETLAKRKKYVLTSLGRMMQKGIPREKAMKQIMDKINALYLQNEKLSPWVIMRREYIKPLRAVKDFLKASERTRERAEQAKAEVRKAQRTVARRYS